jgi:5,5'-dehydrodivanillate O-demethylase oxygenase subunit
MDDATNRILTQVGAGTPMGELLRRYWHPVAAVAELEDHATKPLRLLGEDLVLYRDLGGRHGLIDRHCAHRRADLARGIVEERGLRCHYHGWCYDHTGRCTEQPFEDTAEPGSGFRERIRLKAYKVEALAGLLWAYLGPEPAPLVPNWEPFTWANGFAQVVFSEVPCNWLQAQENSADPVHFEWLHDNWGARLRGNRGSYAPRHLRLEFEEFEHGIVYKRIREGADESNPLWTVGRVCLWPNALFTGNHIEWRVPMDDATTLSVGWFFSRVPAEREPYVQKRVPYWTSPAKDPATGRWITSHLMNQDFAAWAGQGTVADRSREHLGRSDRGIIMMRRRFLADLDLIAKGAGDPKGIVRDSRVNACVALPAAGREAFTRGLTRAERERLGRDGVLGGAGQREFAWLAGQPEEIRDAWRDAMGLD